MMKSTQIFDDSKKPLVKTVKKIHSKGQKFEANSGVLYATKMEAYVFPRKYDADKKIYTCRKKAAQEDCDIPESELSRHINIKVRL